MLKIIIVIIAAAIFWFYAEDIFNESFHDDPDYIKSQQQSE